MSQKIINGTASGMLSALLIKAAHVYLGALHAIKEYTQNSLDAPLVRHVWTILDRPNNSIIFCDDGCGMGGQMAQHDRDLVDLYYQIISDGEAPGCDLREIVSESGMQTLEWLIRNIANSIKGQSKTNDGKPNKELAKYLKATGRQPQKRRMRSTLGKFGIGAWAFLSFAEEMYISSKSHPDLAENLGLPRDNVATFTIVPPNKTKLESFQLAYEMYESHEPLLDPEGNELNHGTVVVIRGISEDAWGELSVESLKAFYHEMFGTRIKETGVEILVGEMGGKLEKVPAQGFRGRLIVDTQITAMDGTACPVMIYYDPKARKLFPKVIKLGTTICDLIDLKAKNQPLFGSPWDSGNVGGFLTFEHQIRGDDDLFDTSKHGILDTPERKFWVAQVKKLEADMLKVIEEIDKESANERLTKSAAMLNSVLSKALHNQGITFTEPKRDTQGVASKPKEPRQPRNLENIIVTVVDRNNRGVSGVGVELTGPHRTWQKPTGASGSIQFTRPIPGSYKVVITTDAPVLGESSQVFEISPQTGVLGKRIRFILDIGDKEKSIKDPQIEVSFNVWDDPDEPWRQSVKLMKLIEFNIGPYTSLHQELDHEHYVIADSLMAEYITSAVMEALGESGDHSSRIRQSNLYAEVYSRLQEARNEGKARRPKSSL